VGPCFWPEAAAIAQPTQRRLAVAFGDSDGVLPVAPESMHAARKCLFAACQP